MLIQLSSGEQLRDEGIEALIQCAPAASQHVKTVFLGLLVVHDPDPVNFDLVRKHITLPPDVHSNVFGAVARTCLQAGLTGPAGLVRSRRPVAHGARLTQWVIGDRSKVNAWLAAHPNWTPSLGSQLLLFKRRGMR